MHGRGSRYRLQLLDLAAKVKERAPWSTDPDIRLLRRGLYRETALGEPTEGLDPIYRELAHAIVDALMRPTLSQLRDVALLLLGNETQLPAAALQQLDWHQVRLRPDRLELMPPDFPRRGPWPCPVHDFCD